MQTFLGDIFLRPIILQLYETIKVHVIHTHNAHAAMQICNACTHCTHVQCTHTQYMYPMYKRTQCTYDALTTICHHYQY